MAETVTEDPPEAVAPDNGDLTIQVRGVSKSFGLTKAVDNLSFEIRRGEVVGFLGPNGSGKTTTMRMLTSFYTPDEGEILIDGVDSQEQDMVTRQSIGYLPENNPLYGDLLVSEAGGVMSDLDGNPLVYNRREIRHPNLIACGPAIYPALMARLRED